MTKKEKRRPTIRELEAILNRADSEDYTIKILPNGEVRAVKRRGKKAKPLTMGEPLGGEYGEAA